MKLYTYFQSSASYRVHIALNLKGLKAGMEYVNLVKGEQKNPAYAAVNPQMLVPSLIDNGKTLTQSLAIMEYLEETYPTVSILPKDAHARAYVRALSLIIACETGPVGNLKIRKYLSEKLGQNDEQVAQWMSRWINDGLAAFEKALAVQSYAGAFCHGDAPTMADCCLVPQLFNARRWKCDLAPYPNIIRIGENCDKNQSFIDAHPKAQADAV